MHFMGLPLTLAEDILELVALSDEIPNVLHLRHVNRKKSTVLLEKSIELTIVGFFNEKLMKTLARKRIYELDQYFNLLNFKTVHLDTVLLLKGTGRDHDIHLLRSFQLQLLLQNVGIEHAYQGSNGFKSTLRNVTDEIVRSLASPDATINRSDILRSVCNVLLDILDFSIIVWHLFESHTSCAELPSELSNDESPSELSDDESPSELSDDEDFHIEGPFQDVDHTSRCVFAIAVAAPYPQIYEAMLCSDVKTLFDSRYEASPLTDALYRRRGKGALVKSVLRDGVGPLFSTRYFGTPLTNAVLCGRKEAVEQILNHDVVHAGTTWPLLIKAFKMAASKGKIEILRLLLQPKYGLAMRLTPCAQAAMTAMEFGQAEAAELVLEQHLELPERQLQTRQTLCFVAAMNNMHNILVRYISNDIDRNSLLFESIWRGQCSITTARILLDHGAQIRSRINPHRDCFLQALRQNRLDLAEFFLSIIDLNKKYKDGDIFYQSRGGSVFDSNVSTLQWLWDQGYDFESNQARKHIQRLLDSLYAWRYNEDVLEWFQKTFGRKSGSCEFEYQPMIGPAGAVT